MNVNNAAAQMQMLKESRDSLLLAAAVLALEV
jgi:hypothetical protein